MSTVWQIRQIQSLEDICSHTVYLEVLLLLHSTYHKLYNTDRKAEPFWGPIIFIYQALCVGILLKKLIRLSVGDH